MQYKINDAFNNFHGYDFASKIEIMMR
jgi:hypothetical protein